MAAGARPLRSLLFVTGMDEAAIRRAAATEVDALILDLEDLVLPAEKGRARQIVRRILDEMGTAGCSLLVRLNPLDSGQTAADLEAVVSPGLHAVALPKITGPQDVAQLAAMLDAQEAKAGLPNGHTLIYPLLETAQSLRTAYEIATASPRVEYLGGSVARGGDLTRSVGFEWTPLGLETLFIRSKVLIDARAAGIQQPITGMTLDLDDLDSLRTMATQSRQLGYGGMLIAYAEHAPLVNDIFSPSADEIAYWQALIAAVDEAARQGKAEVDFRGGFVDVAMRKTGELRLDLARKLGRI